MTSMFTQEEGSSNEEVYEAMFEENWKNFSDKKISKIIDKLSELGNQSASPP